MQFLKQPNTIFHKKQHIFLQKTTTGDQQKRYSLFKLLTSQNPQLFRELDMNQYDLNITQNFQQLQYIDDAITPLIYCAHYGLKQIIKFLLKNRNIDVDMETAINQQTPLIVACSCGNYQIVRLLLLAKAQVNKPNAMNQNPLTAILFRLIEQPVSFQNKRICFKIAQLLIKHGADPNWIVDKIKGYSLLHYFCANKTKLNKSQKQISLQIIRFLLKNGGDPYQTTLKDESVLSLCEKSRNKLDIMSLLEEYNLLNNINVNIKLNKNKNDDQNDLNDGNKYYEQSQQYSRYDEIQ